MSLSRGILAHARAEGFADGWSQSALVHHDEAYMAGQADAEAKAPSRLQWLLVGFFFGIIIGVLFP